MITTRIQIESYLAEYVRGKYYDETVGTVRFPSSSDIYVTVCGPSCTNSWTKTSTCTESSLRKPFLPS